VVHRDWKVRMREGGREGGRVGRSYDDLYYSVSDDISLPAAVENRN